MRILGLVVTAALKPDNMVSMSAFDSPKQLMPNESVKLGTPLLVSRRVTRTKHSS